MAQHFPCYSAVIPLLLQQRGGILGVTVLDLQNDRAVRVQTGTGVALRRPAFHPAHVQAVVAAHPGFALRRVAGIVVFLNKLGDVLAGGLAQTFPFLADPFVEGDGDLSAQVLGLCHVRSSFFDRNARIPESHGESYYQHHQGIPHK